MAVEPEIITRAEGLADQSQRIINGCAELTPDVRQAVSALAESNRLLCGVLRLLLDNSLPSVQTLESPNPEPPLSDVQIQGREIFLELTSECDWYRHQSPGRVLEALIVRYCSGSPNTPIAELVAITGFKASTIRHAISHSRNYILPRGYHIETVGNECWAFTRDSDRQNNSLEPTSARVD